MSEATTKRAGHTFRSAVYLRSLMAELNKAEISARMKAARKATTITGDDGRRSKLTQPAMGELMTMHSRSIQDWENPKHPTVPWDRLDEWAQITGVTKHWLLHGEEQISQPDAAERAAVQEALQELLEAIRRIEGLLQPPAETRSSSA